MIGPRDDNDYQNAWDDIAQDGTRPTDDRVREYLEDERRGRSSRYDDDDD